MQGYFFAMGNFNNSLSRVAGTTLDGRALSLVSAVSCLDATVNMPVP